MTERMLAFAAGEPVVLAAEDIRSSSEAVDGSACEAEVVYPGERVSELWVTSRFIMPSGRQYKVSALRWVSNGDGYIAYISGSRS